MGVPKDVFLSREPDNPMLRVAMAEHHKTGVTMASPKIGATSYSAQALTGGR